MNRVAVLVVILLVLAVALADAWDPGADTPVVPVAAPAQDTPGDKAA